MIARFLRNEGGQAVTIVAVSMTAMLLMVGLAADGGQLFVARRTMQEAADAGAYAGAVVVYQKGTSAQALEQAEADVARNGFTDGGDTTVTVRVPTSGPYAGDDEYVEVIITSQVRTTIMSAFVRALTTVTVRAVAGAEPLNNAYAIIALERGNVMNSLRLGQNGSISIDGAGILVNSTHSQAAYNQDNDGSNFDIESTYSLDVAGGATGPWDGEEEEGAEQQPNPFSGYPKPSTTGMTTYSVMPADGADGAIDGVITINPGIWNVEIKGSGSEYIKMNSGTYILKRGLNGTGQSTLCSTATVNPSGTPACVASNGGVFVFNTTADYPSSTGSCGTMNLNGNGRSTLYPRTSGTYAGMLIYQDEACTNTMTIGGNGELEASGTIYMPNGTFVMAGNNATLTGSQIVANMVDVQQGNLNLTFDSNSTAQPILPRLVE